MRTQRNKFVTLVLIIFTFFFIAISVVLAYALSKKENINPTKSSAAEEIAIPAGWVKVGDINSGHSLGIVQGQLVGIGTTGERGCDITYMTKSPDGTNWSNQMEVGVIGCTSDFIEFNGNLAIQEEPRTGIRIVSMDGQYKPPFQASEDIPFEGDPSRSFENEWGGSIWTGSSIIGTFDVVEPVSDDTARTPQGPKVLFVNRILNDSEEYSAIAFFPNDFNTAGHLAEKRIDNYGDGILIGNEIYIAGNTYRRGGRLEKYILNQPLYRIEDEAVNNTIAAVPFGPTPDASIEKIYYSQQYDKIYVSAFYPGSGGTPLLYSVTRDGNVTSQYEDFPDMRGHIPQNMRVYGDKLFVEINHPFNEGDFRKGPGIIICDLSQAGDITSCGDVQKFDGSKDLEVFNGKLYAIGPNGIYRYTDLGPESLASCESMTVAYGSRNISVNSSSSTNLINDKPDPGETVTFASQPKGSNSVIANYWIRPLDSDDYFNTETNNYTIESLCSYYIITADANGNASFTMPDWTTGNLIRNDSLASQCANYPIKFDRGVIFGANYVQKDIAFETNAWCRNAGPGTGGGVPHIGNVPQSGTCVNACLARARDAYTTQTSPTRQPVATATVSPTVYDNPAAPTSTTIATNIPTATQEPTSTSAPGQPTSTLRPTFTSRPNSTSIPTSRPTTSSGGTITSPTPTRSSTTGGFVTSTIRPTSASTGGNLPASGFMDDARVIFLGVVICLIGITLYAIIKVNSRNSIRL